MAKAMTKTASISEEIEPEIEAQLPPEAEHDLDNFRAAEIDIEGELEGAVVEANEAGEFVSSEETPLGSDQIDKAAFWETWRLAWGMPAMFDPAFEPLAAKDTEKPAVDAIHRLLEIWFPQALKPQNETIGLALVAGPVLAGKVLIVAEVLKHRRAVKMGQLMSSTASPDAPPPDGETGGGVQGAGWLQ